MNENCIFYEIFFISTYLLVRICWLGGFGRLFIEKGSQIMGAKLLFG